MADPNAMDTEAAAAILGGGDNPFEQAPAEVAEDDAAGMMLSDAVVNDNDAEAAALDIFGGDSLTNQAPAEVEENPFEVDQPVEEDGPADIVAEEDAVVEVAEEEEEEAPKKKEGLVRKEKVIRRS